jgi:hypothetical protein
MDSWSWAGSPARGSKVVRLGWIGARFSCGRAYRRASTGAVVEAQRRVRNLAT